MDKQWVDTKEKILNRVLKATTYTVRWREGKKYFGLENTNRSDKRYKWEDFLRILVQEFKVFYRIKITLTKLNFSINSLFTV